MSDASQPRLATDALAGDAGLSPEAIRGEFPIFQNAIAAGEPIVFLDSGASSQKPRCVIEKEVEVYSTYYANAYRGVYRYGSLVDKELERSRESVRRFVNAERADEIAFTSGATASLNMIAFGWGRRHLQPGDEIVVNLLEHHANLVPWQQVAKETGANLVYTPLTADGRVDEAALLQSIGPRTKVVATTGMSNVFGSFAPLLSMAELAHRHGAIFVVDGSQSVPHRRTDVIADQIDFLAFGGHKLYGPTGVGVLYGRMNLLNEMDPLLFGGHMIERVDRYESTWAQPPAKFEAGTLPIAQAIALGTAIEFVETVGIDEVEAHEADLTLAAYEALREVPGISILGPNPIGDVPSRLALTRGAILSFTMEGAASEDIARLLDRRSVFVRHGHHCTMPLHEAHDTLASTRASFAMYNTRDDVEALIDALRYVRKRLRLDR